MRAAGQILGAWLTPVLWLSMPTMIAARGPDGLWIALALVLAPLVAFGLRPLAQSDIEPESIFPVVVLLLTVGALFWANLVLAGDAAGSLGFPRWYGIALAAAGGCLTTGWRGARRAVPALLLVAALMMTAPLVDLVRAAGSGPLTAWEKVATRPAFRFPAGSAWVTRGLPLDGIGDRESIRFDEEHRVTAPAGGRLDARIADGGHPDGRQWVLEAGQSVVLRPGDRLQSGSGVRVQFEPDKRVPGAPASGVAWAAGRRPDWARCAGLLVTLVLGAAALCRAGPEERMSRSTAALLAAVGLGALLWAQLWAVYSLLVSPDVLLGKVTVSRLLLVAHLREDPAGALLQWLPAVGGLASFLASSIALRERLAALDSTGGGEIGRDVVLWTGVFVIAGLAAVWRLDSWFLALLGVGAAGASLGAVRLGSGADVRPRVAALAGSVGLVTFGALAVIDRMRPGTGGLFGAVLAYPALAAAPAAFLTLRLLRAVPSR